MTKSTPLQVRIASTICSAQSSPGRRSRLSIQTGMAGGPHIRLHDARHTFTTWLLQAGVPLKTVSDQLEHSSIAITGNVYSHVTCEIARAAADTLHQAFTTGS